MDKCHLPGNKMSNSEHLLYYATFFIYYFLAADSSEKDPLFTLSLCSRFLVSYTPSMTATSFTHFRAVFNV